MATNINTATVSGNLTADPEVIGDNKGASFSIGTSTGYKDADGKWHERSHFFKVKVWGGQADAVKKYLSKGSPVIVTGRLEQDRWENDKGEKRNAVSINAWQVQFLSRKENGDEI